MKGLSPKLTLYYPGPVKPGEIHGISWEIFSYATPLGASNDPFTDNEKDLESKSNANPSTSPFFHSDPNCFSPSSFHLHDLEPSTPQLNLSFPIPDSYLFSLY